MKTIITQVCDEFTAHNLSGFARKIDGEKIFGGSSRALPSIVEFA
jgi:hypothetical protein